MGIWWVLLSARIFFLSVSATRDGYQKSQYFRFPSHRYDGVVVVQIFDRNRFEPSVSFGALAAVVVDGLLVWQSGPKRGRRGQVRSLRVPETWAKNNVTSYPRKKRSCALPLTGNNERGSSRNHVFMNLARFQRGCASPLTTIALARSVHALGRHGGPRPAFLADSVLFRPHDGWSRSLSAVGIPATVAHELYLNMRTSANGFPAPGSEPGTAVRSCRLPERALERQATPSPTPGPEWGLTFTLRRGILAYSQVGGGMGSID